MKIVYKLTLGFVLISLLVGLIVYVGYKETNSIRDNYDLLTEQTLPVFQNLYIMKFSVTGIIHDTFEISSEPAGNKIDLDNETQEILEESELFESSFKEYQILVNNYFPDEKEYMENIRSSFDTILKLNSEIILIKKYDNTDLKLHEKHLQLEKAELEFNDIIDSAIANENNELIERTENVNIIIENTKKFYLAFGLIIFSISIMIGLFLSTNLSKPIIRLQEVTDEFGKGNLDTRAQIITEDEIGGLSNAFNKMAGDLEKSLNETISSKNYSDNIIKSMADTLIVLNPDFTIQIVNKALLHLLDYKENELIGKNIGLILLEEDLIRNFINKNIDRKDSIIFQELNFLRKDGKNIPVAFSALLLNNNKGKFEGIVCLGKDITEQKIATNKIKASLEEKEVLLREIHHRVKNNMQIISSLLMLQVENIEDKKYRDIFIDSQNRIHAMALIHEKLYQSTNLDNIDIQEYINELSSELLSSYSGKSNIKLELNVEKIPLDINYAVPCGLILNELITNSLKYAFPEGRKGNIKIIFQSKENNMIQFSVNDDGIGIPGDLDIRNTKSLGLRLVTSLAESQLHGNIILIRDHGTQFQIDFRGLK
jgi:PAS domain S-box-containing protein